jgi:ABC-type phosphate transport system substrate-binding protein
MNVKTHIMIWALVLGMDVASSTARADVVAVVSVKNPVASLSKAQVMDIFLGRIDRFPNGSQAIPVDQKEGSPARDEFYARFAGTTAAQLKAYWSKIIFTGRGQPPRTVPDVTAIHELLAANPQVIAYVERSAVDDSMKILARP